MDSEKIEQLKKKVRVKKCLYCKEPLTEEEIEKGLIPFFKHIDMHLKMKGQIALWCNKCDEKIKNGKIKPLGGDLV